MEEKKSFLKQKIDLESPNKNIVPITTSIGGDGKLAIGGCSIEELNIPEEIVHLTGSVELGPITGMAEAIVDLVATGKTLKENGLIKIEDLFYSTARLIGNPLSMRLDDNHLRDTILSIESNNAL